MAPPSLTSSKNTSMHKLSRMGPRVNVLLSSTISEILKQTIGLFSHHSFKVLKEAGWGKGKVRSGVHIIWYKITVVIIHVEDYLKPVVSHLKFFPLLFYLMFPRKIKHVYIRLYTGHRH